MTAHLWGHPPLLHYLTARWLLQRHLSGALVRPDQLATAAQAVIGFHA